MIERQQSRTIAVPFAGADKITVMWNTTERGILCKVGLYIICDSLIAERGAFSLCTAVRRGSASFSAR